MCSQAVELGILKHSVSKIILDVLRFFVANTNEGLDIKHTLYFQETIFNCTAINRSGRGTLTSLSVLNRQLVFDVT